MDVEQANERSRLAATVGALVAKITEKDRYTGGHTLRVMHFATLIARELGMSEALVERVRLGAALHDLGKIGVSGEILRKPSALDASESKAMSRHPDIGAQYLGDLREALDVDQSTYDEVVSGIRFHHERWDGTGYPDRLRGTEIPWVARIVAVADAFDAMTSHRPYRRGLKREVAVAELAKQSGAQFCPASVEAFVRAYSRGFRVEWRAGSGHHGGHALV